MSFCLFFFAGGVSVGRFLPALEGRVGTVLFHDADVVKGVLHMGAHCGEVFRPQCLALLDLLFRQAFGLGLAGQLVDTVDLGLFQHDGFLLLARPSTPSAGRPLTVWKALTAEMVPVPKMPSALPVR